MSSLIGKPLQGGKYKLDEVLGRGGFGLTFRAHQTYLDQVVVIKTLNESYWDAPNISDLQQQFQDEARRLALCSHPNVVRVSDFFLEDGLPYMVMDYIPGRSLFDIVLPNNPLSEAEATAYAQQIGQALQAVHAKGLLHRDVKPQNIMIHQLTGEAVLIDFGIARELTKNPAQTHTSIVSEGYAPIEQYLPKAHRSAATDIYGLAATLYTLLTAQVPVAAVLRDRTPLAPISQIRPDISPTVIAAIAHGMEIELKDRPQSVGPWLSELTAQTVTRRPITQNPSTTSAVPTKVVSPAYRPTERNHKRNQTESGNRTVAAMPPTGYGIDKETAAYRPVVQPKGKGCGCASTLMILGIAIAAAFAGGGYWLYQQANNELSNQIEIALPDEGILPDITLPEITLPEIKLPKKEQPEASDTDAAVEEDNENETTDETSEEADTADNPEPFAAESVPLALGNIGNPANDQPGSSGAISLVPGIPPGVSEDRIREQLGNPTRTDSANGYDTAVYSLVPNRVTLAYTYETGELMVRQSEAAFAPSTNRLIIRTALVNMLDGRSTRRIENGLEAVRKGERDRFDFERKGFSGVIERNENGYLHIYVRTG